MEQKPQSKPLFTDIKLELAPNGNSNKSKKPANLFISPLPSPKPGPSPSPSPKPYTGTSSGTGTGTGTGTDSKISSDSSSDYSPYSSTYPSPCPSPKPQIPTHKKKPDQSSSNPNATQYQHLAPSPGRSPPFLPIAEKNKISNSANAAQGTGAVTSSSTGTGSNRESTDSTGGGPVNKHHTRGDIRWEAIQVANSRDAPLNLGHFRLLKRLGYGDIGSVYLVELRGTGTYFAMKVMDKASLISRNKLIRAETEREILGLLDHPFLPTLYSYFETDKFYCLVMEYCSGGNLHSLRQKQQSKRFTEHAARFYASEVLLALEYLHMLGIVYRDLKPENILIREEGHIMLSDFDLSLRCSTNPTLVKSASVNNSPSPKEAKSALVEGDGVVQGCIQPSAFFPRILPKHNRKSKSDFGIGSTSSVEFNAEPTSARSMSFVGTHEYLAPEIIKGQGHGSAVDWWTFGIFLYELLHGLTPFRGNGNRATLYNVLEQPLRFPEDPSVSSAARDLIRGLLIKDPQKRIAYRRGATEIKQHPFFEGVNWALIRSSNPPFIPDPVDFKQFAGKDQNPGSSATSPSTSTGKKTDSTDSSSYIDFEYF